MIEGDREVIEDAETDDMFIAEGDDKSRCWLKGTNLNSTPIYRGLNLAAIGKCPALIIPSLFDGAV